MDKRIELTMEHNKSVTACCRSSDSRVRTEAMDKLDRPNLHRNLEFAVFFFPAVGFNVAHMSELLFEKLHGYVKMAVRQSRPGESEAVFVMTKIAEDEFVSRLSLDNDSAGPASAFRPSTDAAKRDFISRSLNRHRSSLLVQRVEHAELALSRLDPPLVVQVRMSKISLRVCASL
jgi:hypothetical protein